MEKRKKLLFFKKSSSSFADTDEKFLKTTFDVYTLNQDNAKGIGQLMFHLRQFFFLLKYGFQSSYFFIWFADYHAFLPLLFSKIFNIKSVIVIGGFDAEKNQELNYGVHLNPFRSWVVKKCCDWTSLIFPVSIYTQNRLFENLAKDYSSKSVIIYNGVDHTFFKGDDDIIKREGIITICKGDTIRRLKVKGIDFFARVAEKMPDVSFKIIGIEKEAKDYLIKKYPSSNLELLPPCNKVQIKKYLKSSKVVCQFSRFESFGIAIVEGILCGCIPVVSKVGGLPEVINKTGGFILDFREEDLAVSILRQVLGKTQSEENSMAVNAKKYFSSQEREQLILTNLEKLT